MNNWQSSSSKSCSNDSPTGDSRAAAGSKNTLKSVLVFSRRSHSPTSSGKFHHEFWPSPTRFENSPTRSSSSASSTSFAAACPQPLPLPKLQPANGSLNQRARGKEKGVEKKQADANAIDKLHGFNKLTRPDDGNREEGRCETWSSKKSLGNQNGAARLSDNYKSDFPTSASTSPCSIPEKLTVQKGFSYQMLLDKTSSSVDNTPVHSPIVHSHWSAMSLPMHKSPLPNKVINEISLARNEGNAQATLHPLPLPPGADLSTAALKHEFVPYSGQWQKGKLLGRGAFGCVYVASNRETGALCAMKEVEILPDDQRSAECIRQSEQEIKVLSQLKHPNIVQYYGSETVGDRFYIYLEYVHPGSINKFIHDHCEAMTESVVRSFTRHILCGLAYLHSMKTIHRDIKCANLLVDAHGVVKLADFGMSKHLPGQMANLSLKGSPYWMAPELLQPSMQKKSSSDLALAVDVWSLGCTIIEMLNGKPPFCEYEGAAALFKVLKETPPIPETLSAEGKDFLRCCLRRNPAERPKASLLLEHPFVKHSLKDNALSFPQPLLQ